MQIVIEKRTRFVINAKNKAEVLRIAKTYDDKSSLPYYGILGVLKDEKAGEIVDKG